MRRLTAIVILAVVILTMPLSTYAGGLGFLKFWDRGAPSILFLVNEREYSVDVHLDVNPTSEHPTGYSYIHKYDLEPGTATMVTANDIRSLKEGDVATIVIFVSYVKDGEEITDTIPKLLRLKKSRHLRSRVFEIREFRK